MNEMMDCMGGGGCMRGMHWLMWIFWILLLALIIWAVIYLVKRSRNGRPTEDTPAEILQRRYAAGEISTEEYEERKRKLGE